jgi:DNA-binding NarL/FixJ family response regulator
VSSAPIRVIVADDHAVVREGIRSVLDKAKGFDVVAEVSDGDEALAAVETHRPDVLVLDITMPHLSGLDVVAALRARRHATRVLILSMHDHPEYVLEAIRAGADGYILKTAAPAQVRLAVRTVAEGRQFVPEPVAQRLGEAIRDEVSRQRDKKSLDELTPRERDVLVRVASGSTSRQIAEELGISHRTVEAHRDSMMRKLQIRSIAGLTRFAIEAGLLSD